jgi:hypothetical protein
MTGKKKRTVAIVATVPIIIGLTFQFFSWKGSTPPQGLGDQLPLTQSPSDEVASSPTSTPAPVPFHHSEPVQKPSHSEEEVKNEVDPYENDLIISTKETKPDNDGNFVRHKVLQTPFKYSLVHVKENVNRDPKSEEEQVLNRTAMVADHVIVKLEHGYTEADLNQLLKTMGYQIRKTSPSSHTYLVSFDGKDTDALDKALSELKKSKMISHAEIDYIIRGN